MNIRDICFLLIVGTLIALFVVAMSGCEIVPIGTTAKLKALQKKARTGRQHHTSHRRAASQDTMYVSPAWLQEYHEMEAEHGGYSIGDDAKIKHEGDKVRVPRTVLKHFHDLSKITPPPPDD
jgi:hypothetical protein